MNKTRQKQIDQAAENLLKLILEARAESVKKHKDSPGVAAAMMLRYIRLDPILSVKQLSKLTGLPTRGLLEALSTHGMFKKKGSKWVSR